MNKQELVDKLKKDNHIKELETEIEEFKQLLSVTDAQVKIAAKYIAKLQFGDDANEEQENEIMSMLLRRAVTNNNKINIGEE